MDVQRSLFAFVMTKPCHYRSDEWTRGRWPILFAVLFLLVLPALPQPQSLAIAHAEDSAVDERMEHLQMMRAFAEKLEVQEQVGGKPLKSKLVEKPLLTYRDDTRKQFDSSVWLWQREGIPVAILALEHYPQNKDLPPWLYEITSLSSMKIDVQQGPELQFKAREAGGQFQEVSKAPSPARRAPARLTQMRQLRERFTAYEQANIEGRIELRPLSAPLHRYAAPASGVIDGAIFAFSNGTNPEVLWIIEAYRHPDGREAWRYALGQMTGEVAFVELDGKKVWTGPAAVPPAKLDRYTNGWFALPPLEKSAP